MASGDASFVYKLTYSSVTLWVSSKDGVCGWPEAWEYQLMTIVHVSLVLHTVSLALASVPAVAHWRLQSRAKTSFRHWLRQRYLVWLYPGERRIVFFWSTILHILPEIQTFCGLSHFPHAVGFPVILMSWIKLSILDEGPILRGMVGKISPTIEVDLILLEFVTRDKAATDQLVVGDKIARISNHISAYNLTIRAKEMIRPCTIYLLVAFLMPSQEATSALFEVMVCINHTFICNQMYYLHICHNGCQDLVDWLTRTPDV